MKGKIDRAQIRHVAELAELSLSAEEEEKLVKDVGAIVDYFAELDAIDTTDVPATAIVVPAGGQYLRPDEPAFGLAHEDALKGAPNASHGGFTVPTFVE